MIKNKRILIAGGAGSIGSELTCQLSKKNKIYVLDLNESGLFNLVDYLKGRNVWGRVGDIRDYKTVQDVFDDFKPQIVINTAAYKHVPLMEYTPLEAIQTNVIGHYNLIHVARTWECVEKFVFVSSDKSVNSTSIMGATKKLGEIITCNQGKGYFAVRFGNVLGSRGSLTTIWQRQINQNDSLTVTDPRMERYFMSIEDAIGLIIKAIELANGGEIFCLDMGKKVNILALAKRLTEEMKFGNIKINGIRDGEILEENLMSKEESERAFKKEGFWIISPKYENQKTNKGLSQIMA